MRSTLVFCSTSDVYTSGDFNPLCVHPFGILAGEIVVPTVSAKEPFVDCDGIADMAVAAFTDGSHEGKTYEMTGPELLDFEQITAAVSKAVKRPIAFQTFSIGE